MTPISARGIPVMPTTLSGWPTTAVCASAPLWTLGRSAQTLGTATPPDRVSSRRRCCCPTTPTTPKSRTTPTNPWRPRSSTRTPSWSTASTRTSPRTQRLLGRLRAVGALGRARPVARAVARGARVVPVEAGALEGHADRRVDLAQPPAAVGALGQRGVTELLNRVEGVAARGARIRIRRHGGGLLRSWAAVGQAARKSTWGTRRDPNRFPTVRPTPRGGRPRRRRGSAARPCGARPPC